VKFYQHFLFERISFERIRWNYELWFSNHYIHIMVVYGINKTSYRQRDEVFFSFVINAMKISIKLTVAR